MKKEDLLQYVVKVDGYPGLQGKVLDADYLIYDELNKINTNNKVSDWVVTECSNTNAMPLTDSANISIDIVSDNIPFNATVLCDDTKLGDTINIVYNNTKYPLKYRTGEIVTVDTSMLKNGSGEVGFNITKEGDNWYTTNKPGEGSEYSVNEIISVVKPSTIKIGEHFVTPCSIRTDITQGVSLNINNGITPLAVKVRLYDTVIYVKQGKVRVNDKSIVLEGTDILTPGIYEIVELITSEEVITVTTSSIDPVTNNDGLQYHKIENLFELYSTEKPDLLGAEDFNWNCRLITRPPLTECKLYWTIETEINNVAVKQNDVTYYLQDTFAGNLIDITQGYGLQEMFNDNLSTRSTRFSNTATIVGTDDYVNKEEKVEVKVYSTDVDNAVLPAKTIAQLYPVADIQYDFDQFTELSSVYPITLGGESDLSIRPISKSYNHITSNGAVYNDAMTHEIESSAWFNYNGLKYKPNTILTGGRNGSLDTYDSSVSNSYSLSMFSALNFNINNTGGLYPAEDETMLPYDTSRIGGLDFRPSGLVGIYGTFTNIAERIYTQYIDEMGRLDVRYKRVNDGTRNVVAYQRSGKGDPIVSQILLAKGSNDVANCYVREMAEDRSNGNFSAYVKNMTVSTNTSGIVNLYAYGVSEMGLSNILGSMISRWTTYPTDDYIYDDLLLSSFDDTGYEDLAQTRFSFPGDIVFRSRDSKFFKVTSANQVVAFNPMLGADEDLTSRINSSCMVETWGTIAIANGSRYAIANARLVQYTDTISLAAIFLPPNFRYRRLRYMDVVGKDIINTGDSLEVVTWGYDVDFLEESNVVHNERSNASGKYTPSILRYETVDAGKYGGTAYGDPQPLSEQTIARQIYTYGYGESKLNWNDEGYAYRHISASGIITYDGSDSPAKFIFKIPLAAKIVSGEAGQAEYGESYVTGMYGLGNEGICDSITFMRRFPLDTILADDATELEKAGIMNVTNFQPRPNITIVDMMAYKTDCFAIHYEDGEVWIIDYALISFVNYNDVQLVDMDYGDSYIVDHMSPSAGARCVHTNIHKMVCTGYGLDLHTYSRKVIPMDAKMPETTGTVPFVI